ncbi:uncharacterized protein EI90DRAFT_3087005 [Cantharellus anzutake]|uniref:uncharacterized protein n=1 Tax=Cantharellus anzutake TaxID=1750568 RepID=UPI001905D018|nr:uncharacterized protein EI90DRAFT_3087005 [Cantharellus anzutake]KAF8316217.1 hypothetical protein EI90DRAFT_3087005 [Cantharellus anzutake]
MNDALADEDWKTKYEEVMETLQETEQELQDFQVSSRELEEELAKELELAEKAKEDMQRKFDKAENEKDEWKSKFMSLQSTHTTTVNSLQRELEALRESNHLVKIQLRELEMGNDDLEHHERAVISSLEDLEQKYSKLLEEKILLEHELQDKAALEEGIQRVKDELRDAQTEISVLQEKLEKAPPMESPLSDRLGPDFNPPIPSPESLLQAPLPSDELRLTDLANAQPPTPPVESDLELEIITGQSALLRKAGFVSPPPGKSKNPSSPSASPSRLPGPTQRRPLTTSISAPNNAGMTSSIIRPTTQRSVSVSTTTSALAARSRGMQMVSDMRSRVKTLEQRIQNRVPRLRKLSTRASPLPVSKEPRSSSEKEKDGSDPGWVFVKDNPRVESRSSTSSKERVASPPPPSAFRVGGLAGSGLRPPSRAGNRPKSVTPMTSQLYVGDPGLSRSSSSNPNIRPKSNLSPFPTNNNDAMIRPVTPTMIPVPGGSDALKRSVYGHRSSLGTLASLQPQPSGANAATIPANTQSTTVRAKSTSGSMPSRPPLPSMLPSPRKSPPTRATNTTNVTAGRSSIEDHQDPLQRPGSHLGMSSRTALSSSKIGRPSSLTASATTGRSSSDTRQRNYHPQ